MRQTLLYHSSAGEIMFWPHNSRSRLPLRSGHLWQETWQLFCSGYMAEVYSHLWAGASWEEESSGVPQDTLLAPAL